MGVHRQQRREKLECAKATKKRNKRTIKGICKFSTWSGSLPDFPAPGTRAPPSLQCLSKLPLNLAQDQPAVPGPKKSSRIVREVLPMAQLLPSAKQWGALAVPASAQRGIFHGSIFLVSIGSLGCIYVSCIYIYAMVKTIWKTQDQRQIGDGLFHPVEGQSQFHTSRLTKWGLSRKKWFHLSKWYFPMTWNRYQHWSNGLTLLTTLITTTSNQYVSNTFYSHIIYLHITWLNMLI
jgi:hypothetical protein